MAASRSSKYELLRIVAMVLILIHHFCMYAGNDDLPLANAIANDVLMCGGKIGVNVFVIITGYFMVTSRFKVQSFLRVLCEAWFYSFVLGLLCALGAPETFDIKTFLKSFLPTSNGLPWFVTAYLGLYLMIPWLARFAREAPKEVLRRLLVVGFVVFALIPTLTGSMFVTGNLTWFVYLFLLSGYIRLYGFNGLKKWDPVIMLGGRVCVLGGLRCGCGADWPTCLFRGRKRDLLSRYVLGSYAMCVGWVIRRFRAF